MYRAFCSTSPWIVLQHVCWGNMSCAIPCDPWQSVRVKLQCIAHAICNFLWKLYWEETIILTSAWIIGQLTSISNIQPITINSAPISYPHYNSLSFKNMTSLKFSAKRRQNLAKSNMQFNIADYPINSKAKCLVLIFHWAALSSPEWMPFPSLLTYYPSYSYGL